MPTIIKATATAKGRRDDGAIVVPYAIDVIPDAKPGLSGDAAAEDEKLSKYKALDDEEEIVVPLTFRQKWGTAIITCCVCMLRTYG